MASVEAVLAALKIVPSETKRGRIFALCPFHEDKDPSWSIATTRQHFGLYHCFSCGAGGNLLKLVKHVLELESDHDTSWVEKAQMWLSQLGGEEPAPEPEPMPAMVRLNVGRLRAPSFRFPRGFIQEPLADWVTPARRYAAEKRKITAEQVSRWALGYAVDGRLAGRIIIPTFRHSGEPASYMARSFSDAEKTRYLYPEAREGADLDAMFGEVYWPPPSGGGRRAATVVVTEGAFNALAVERADQLRDPTSQPWYVAALGGSILRPAHLGKLASFGTVVLLTDSDAAGDKAAAEVYSALGRYVTSIRRVRPELPKGKDANDMFPEDLLRCLSQ